MPASGSTDRLGPLEEAVLANFPAHVYPLTIVSDPDGLLADPVIHDALGSRGFRFVRGEDPVRFRLDIERVRPWSTDRPVIAVSGGDLRDVPFDLWHSGHRVSISLATHFPQLNVAGVRLLTASQRRRLATVPGPTTRLGADQTTAFILDNIFDARVVDLTTAAGLVGWLRLHHDRAEPLPEPFRNALLGRTRGAPALEGIPVADILDSAEAFETFVQQQWQLSVRRKTGVAELDEDPPYVLRFDDDVSLQDTLPGLLRAGIVQPVAVTDPAQLPKWIQPGVLAESDSQRELRATALRNALQAELANQAVSRAWRDWQTIAHLWAGLTAIRLGDSWSPFSDQAHGPIQQAIDEQFTSWLQSRYSALSGQALPEPHHIFHVPQWLAYERRQGRMERVALVIIDGMSLVDWTMIAPVWRRRNRDWRRSERLVLAQVPTITSVSRQALSGGLRPSQFAATLGTTNAERQLWEAFWHNEGISATSVSWQRFQASKAVDVSSSTQALLLVVNAIDDIVHGATLGAHDVASSLGLWLAHHSAKLEAAIGSLLDVGFKVVIASDHGHVEARGVGAPSEGVAVESRGRRARIYRNRVLAERAHQSIGVDTILWSDDGLLPDEVFTVMPRSRDAFAPAGHTVVTHGGISIEEVVVPLVTIQLDRD